MDIGGMLQRTIRAAMLDGDLYEEVEHDNTLDREALTVVIIAAILDAVGLVIARYMSPEGVAPVRALLLSAYMIFGGIFVYFLWAGLTYMLGVGWFGGSADVYQLRRTLGYAQGPRALGLFVFLPVVGIPLNILSLLWSLVAGIVAVRHALDVSWSRTLAVVVIGWGVAIMMFMFAGFLLGFQTILLLIL